MKYIELRHEAGAAIIIISRVKAMNALNLEVLAELEVVFDSIDVSSTSAVILTGAGKKAFVAGADIGAMRDLSPKKAREFTDFGSGVLRKIETFPLPVIAAVNGYALGGGLELALACDVRIASENAVFGMPELRFGIIPGFGGTQRLIRTIPIGMAKEMIYTGMRLDSTKALHLGLVNAVFQREDLMEHAIIIAKRISKNSKEAVIKAKKAMNEGLSVRLELGLEIESDQFAECFGNEDQVNRMDAFLNKE